MFEIKRRRKANISMPNEDQQKKQTVSRNAKALKVDLRTVSSLLSLVVSLGLSWFFFQQSVQLATVEEKYHILKQETIKFQDMENKISIISEKCEMALSLTEQLEDHKIISQMKRLQEEINIMQIKSNQLIQEEQQLQKNLTPLFHAVVKYEENTASLTKAVSAKIMTVKTDIRRISGLQAEMTLLTENLEAIEDKIKKVEKTTVQSIGDVLMNSIDRTTKLRNIASENTREIEHIKIKSSELNADLTKQFNKFLDLESDRAKVLTTVAFANDLKPKVHNLKNDLAHLLLMLEEFTLRIGRLFEDLLERQSQIAFLNKKLSNLSSVYTAVD